VIPTAEIVDFSNDFGGWYRAPGCLMETEGRRRAEQGLIPTVVLYDGWYDTMPS
jgi:hypothetical protein